MSSSLTTQRREEVRGWLQQEGPRLQDEALERDPNLLPAPRELSDFYDLLVRTVLLPPDAQLSALHTWLMRDIGGDTALANDWLTLLRLLKEGMLRGLQDDFGPGQALAAWRLIDPLFTHALVEVARLAAETDRAIHLEYMAELRQQLERLNQSKANFVAIAAHELKTPLTLLEGYTDMMHEALPAAEATALQVYLGGFRDGTRRLRAIIQDMLDITQLDAQSLKLHYQPVFVDKLLRIQAERLERAYEERGVAIACESLPLSDAVYADPELLSKAIHKLLENALKYTPDGGSVTVSGAVTRRREATAEIDGYLDIRFADTGIGINPEDLNTIFEKFVAVHDVSLHSSGKTKFKGSGPGLGLAIVRGIVEAHGGRVWAESPGHDEVNCPGSTFHAELPIRNRPPPE